MLEAIVRAPKSLDDHHRSTAPVHHALLARSPAEEAENRTHGAPHDGTAKCDPRPTDAARVASLTPVIEYVSS